MKAKIKLFAAEFTCEFENLGCDLIPGDESEIGEIYNVDGNSALLSTFLEMGFEDEIRCAILDSRYFDVEC